MRNYGLQVLFWFFVGCVHADVYDYAMWTHVKTCRSRQYTWSVRVEHRWASAGITTPEWEKVVNVMLLKEHNNFCTTWLRAIGLLDSLYNHNSKQLGCSMMAHAENHEQIAIEQYGSRKNKACVDQSLNKVFTTDDWRVHQTCGIICSTNLQSCYDCMVLSATTVLASICDIFST